MLADYVRFKQVVEINLGLSQQHSQLLCKVAKYNIQQFSFIVLFPCKNLSLPNLYEHDLSSKTAAIINLCVNVCKTVT